MSAEPALPPESVSPEPAGGARRAYVPLRHPAGRERWTAAEIVAALGAWVAETGHPPRRSDWTGERPGHAGEAQRKWMREHPRWPSASSVARHLGSWSAALAAAGLPGRRLAFDAPVTHRVMLARSLAAAGVSRREIAERLSVSPASVGNYINARDCPGCGGPITHPRAERCRDCTRHTPTVPRAWTRAEALAAIRDWTATHGAPPSYRDWTPSRAAPGEWEAESPRWPSAAVVCDVFADHPDPWNAALVAAGVAPRARRWSDDGVRAALAAVWVARGRAPVATDLGAADWAGPSARTLQRRFGGLADAWAALAPAPVDPARHPRPRRTLAPR